MKKKKSRKFLIRRIVAIIIVLTIAILVRNCIYSSLEKNKSKEIRLLYNNEFITLTNEAYVENDNIYISEDDIKNIFDNTIYYNVGDKELITTFNKHVAVMHLNENEVNINDSEIKANGELKEIDSKIYLPITDLEVVYDIEVDFSDETNMIIMDSTSKAKSQAIALKNISIKKAKLPFSFSLEKVSRGDVVFVLEDVGNFKKVKTQNGNIGYVRKKQISDEEVLREDLQEEKEDFNVLEEYSDINNTYDEVQIDEDKENIVILESFELEKESEIAETIDVSQENYKNYYNWTTENDIDIVGRFTDNDTVSASMTTYSQRNKIINMLYDNVMKNQFKGILIDFEEIDDINSFNRFLIELTPKFKESGLKVIVKINKYLEKDKIKDIVDFILE